MAAAKQDKEGTKSYLVQCSPENFEYAAWLSAVGTEIVSVNEQKYRLHISALTDLVKAQFEKLGAVVTKIQPFLV